MVKIETLNVLELFGGIGAIRKALIRQKIPYKVIDYVEIDKNCVKSYNALYNADFKPKSIIGYNPPKQRIEGKKGVAQGAVFYLRRYGLLKK